MLKQIYYKNLPCGVGAPTLVTLPIQVLGLKVGEETPQNIDFADITNLKVRLKKSGSTGVGVDLTTEGVEKYEVQGNAITITLTARKKDDIDEVSIVGQYGNVGVYAVIKLFYKSGQNEFVLNPYIIRVTDAGEGGGTGGGGIIEGTYAEIKALRDSGGLSVGSWYRITDFVTTTTQENTQSAQHPFDVLVLATDVNQFSEHARAMHHVGDTYFSTANIEAWDVWYCFDNDTNRFKWADEENGKGVIWRMVDEWGNDCPYDFKNILYLSDGQYYYTFDHNTDSTHVDFSIFGNDKSISTSTNGCYENVMGAYVSSQGLMQLNVNIFKNIGMSINCCGNVFGANCYNNTFGNNCNYNTFGNNCYSNTFLYSINMNTFENDFYSNTTSADFQYNTFKGYCHDNIFGASFRFNKFNGSCSNNKFEGNSFFNIYGYSFNNNMLGYGYFNNTFGEKCTYNIFGSSDKELKSYMNNITFGNGVQYVRFTCSATTSSSVPCQNVHVNSGITNKTITIPTAGNKFLTTVGSSSDTKINV